MEEPEITKKPEEIHPLSKELTHLIDTYVRTIEEAKKPSTPIHVDEIASRIAKFYEMIRKVIDWKEDSVLRRSAIERVLKRTLFPKLSGMVKLAQVDTYRVAYTITADLIRGGHLPNDEIAQEKVVKVEIILKKYLYILEHAVFPSHELIPIKRKVNFTAFVIELTAVDIEEILSNSVKERILLEAMTDMLTNRIRVLPEGAVSETDKKTHVFIATCRTLYDLDDGYILVQLLRYSHADWYAPSQKLLDTLSTNIPNLWLTKDTLLDHPLSRQLYDICERIDTVFMLIGDVIDTYKESPEKIKKVMSDKIQLTEVVTEAYNKRYLSLKSRLIRLAIFSTLSVFLSNWVTFFIIEVPMASWLYEGFNLFTAIIDFVIPTAVMFALVSIIRPPPESNCERVLSFVYQFVYDDEKVKLYDVLMKQRRNRVFALIMLLMYLTMMFGVLGFVGYVFYIAGLPITSVVFDTFTIALTFFAAAGIRNKSKELSVDDRTGIWEFLLDMISVPIAKVGEILAKKWKEYNIVAILFTFLIETPMIVVLDFIGNWSQYLKERRAELH